MPSLGIGSRVIAFLIMGILTGCGEGVQVIRESENSGVVRYIYQAYQGHLVTSRRAKAMEKAREYCDGPFQIIREGPTQSRKRVVEGLGGGDVIEEKWWGVRFQCQ